MTLPGITVAQIRSGIGKLWFPLISINKVSLEPSHNICLFIVCGDFFSIKAKLNM